MNTRPLRENERDLSIVNIELCLTRKFFCLFIEGADENQCKRAQLICVFVCYLFPYSYLNAFILMVWVFPSKHNYTPIKFLILPQIVI